MEETCLDSGEEAGISAGSLRSRPAVHWPPIGRLFTHHAGISWPASMNAEKAGGDFFV